MTNRELYIKAVELVGKEVMEVKQRQFLQRIIKKAGKETPPVSPSQRGIEYQEIITYLNNQTGKQFRWNTPKTKALMQARLNEGFTVEEFKQVIEIKCKQWLTSDYFNYLRPATLFGSKFEGYLQEWIVFKKKEEYQRKEHLKINNQKPGIEGNEEAQVSAEDLQKQKEWAELSKKLIAEATKEDWTEYYHQEKLFKKQAYTKGLNDPLVRNLFAYYLKTKKLGVRSEE